MYKIRKFEIVLKDALFWIIFAFLIALLGIVPSIINWAVSLLGIISPVNFIFLIILFILIIKLFSISMKMSSLESKLQALIQKYAIDKKEESDEKIKK